MELHIIYLHVGICMLILSTSLAGLLGRDTNIDQETESEVRLLSRLLEAEKHKMVAPEEAETELREEKETVEKIDDDRTKMDISVGNELIERRIRDCKKKYEIIVLNNHGTNNKQQACYLHDMDDTLYAFACLGKGDKPHQTYNIKDEVLSKDFLSRDGPDSVCRDLPMFSTTNANEVYRDNTPSMRGLNVNKRACRWGCGIRCNGWSCSWQCWLQC